MRQVGVLPRVSLDGWHEWAFPPLPKARSRQIVCFEKYSIGIEFELILTFRI